MEIRKIATIRNDYTERFGVPRQSGLAPEVRSRIVFEKEYRNPDALRGIEGFTHLWLIWEFDRIERDGSYRPMVRPPKLGGNTRVGVWATRSPYRPNPLGLTVVRLVGTEQTAEGPVLVVEGADLMNGTPIYDIKPYVPYADCVAGAVGGFADEHAGERLRVTVPEEVRAAAASAGHGEEWLAALAKVLSADPRPAYQNDPQRRYGMRYGDAEVAFVVNGGELTVTEIANVVPEDAQTL